MTMLKYKSENYNDDCVWCSLIRGISIRSQASILGR